LKDSIAHLNEPDKSLLEIMQVRFRTNSGGANNKVIFNPFFQSFIKENPFKLSERHFPVDFGAPQKLYTVITLHYPEGYKIVSAPGKTLLALPESGGKYFLVQSSLDKMLIIKTVIQQNKPVYSAKEYPSLKEFYNRIIQSQRVSIILSKS
jgi:hypothetical protein